LSDYLVDNQQERDELAQLNLTACHKARAATAYQAAREYAKVGLELLGTDAWQRQYEMILALHDLAAEVAFLAGDFEQMNQWIEAVIHHAKTPLEQVQVYQVKIQALVAHNKFVEAIAIGQSVFQMLGVNLPDEPTLDDIQQLKQEIDALIEGRSIESFFDLPKMSDRQQLAIMQNAARLTPVCYMSGTKLYFLVVALQVKLSIQFGNSPVSAFCYVGYAFQLRMLWSDMSKVPQFGQLGYQLALEPDGKNIRAATAMLMGAYVGCWTIHLRDTLPILLDGYQAGLETGNLEFMGYDAQLYCFNAYWYGQPLTDLEPQIRAYYQQLCDLNQFTAANCVLAYWQAAQILLGQSEEEIPLRQDAYEEKVLAEAKVDFYRLSFFYLYRFTLNYWLEDFAKAEHDAAQTRHYLAGGMGSVVEPIFYFYDSLNVLATSGESITPSDPRWQRIEENQAKLKEWADYGPMNFLHKYHLVEAQKHQLLNCKTEALELYDLAINGAQENGYVQEEALANELAAKFYLKWGKEKIAQTYMQEAYYGYARWGAKAKTEHLEKCYPQLLQPILQQQQIYFNPLETIATIGRSSSSSTQTSSSTSISNALDFASVLKAAQAISSSIKIDELIASLTRILLETSGAKKSVLILPQKDTWQVRAITSIHHEANSSAYIQTILESQPLETCQNIPQNIIHYVRNTQQTVVIEQLQTDIPGLIGEYMLTHQPQSVFCLPILHQKNLVGILYLENQFTKGVFTNDRLQVINLLASQVGISLENARLYEQAQTALQESQQTQQLLRKVIDNIPQIVFWKDRNSVYLGCNNNFAQTANLRSPEDMVGKTDYDLPWTEAEVNWYRECDRRIMDANQPELHIIETLQQADGKTLWIDTNKIPLSDANGNVFGILGTTEDITERKLAEEALQQRTIDLENALTELQHLQLQLVQNEKMSALGNLVAGVAHEINNPVGFIAGNIEPAKDYIQDLFGLIELYQQKFPHSDAEIAAEIEAIDFEYLQEDLPKLIDSMKLGVERIRNISTSLRTFSRADKDYKVPFNIHEGIDSTILILKHRLKANDDHPAIEVVKEYGNLLPVDCFPGQLNQVFMNILANAIDALEESNQGSSFAEIQSQPNCITIRTEMKENQWAIIRIADNGVGMTQEVKQHIFDHLFTTKMVGKGTGLGLAIAHQIVTQKHGGTIEVNSVPSQGTEFAIVLLVKG
jgi:protein kinase